MKFFDKFSKKIDYQICWCKANCICEEKTALTYNSEVCANCLGNFFTEKNFGDLITPYIYEKIKGKKPVFYSNKVKSKVVFFGAGSHLGGCQKIKNAVIWGTGIIDKSTKFDKPKNILAVRGPLTRNRCFYLGFDCPMVFGDPGLLLPNFYTSKSKKEYKVGIIPHYIDLEFCKKLFTKNNQILIIDVRNDVENVIDEINKCEFTISSSLHGIIASHAYGIKSCWIKFSDYLIGDNTKFLDYYYSLDLAYVNNPIQFDKEFLNYIQNIDELIEIIEKFPNPKFPINTEKLLKTCPF